MLYRGYLLRAATVATILGLMLLSPDVQAQGRRQLHRWHLDFSYKEARKTERYIAHQSKKRRRQQRKEQKALVREQRRQQTVARTPRRQPKL